METLLLQKNRVNQRVLKQEINQLSGCDKKYDIIAAICHELKTPVAAIKMSLKLLSDDRIGTVNCEQSELIEFMKDDSERLSKIITELLKFLQLKANKLELNAQIVRSAQVITEAINAVELTAKQKSIKFITTDQTGQCVLNVDLDKTSWVLINFLANAIRYSPIHSEIRINAIQYINTIVFSVTDFGKGIKKKEQHKLFEPYFRVPVDNAERESSGLGLFVCKTIVEGQHGSVWVKSEPGTGSTFYFSLPCLVCLVHN